jgi:hypothetical protein
MYLLDGFVLFLAGMNPDDTRQFADGDHPVALLARVCRPLDDLDKVIANGISAEKIQALALLQEQGVGRGHILAALPAPAPVALAIADGNAWIVLAFME